MKTTKTSQDFKKILPRECLDDFCIANIQEEMYTNKEEHYIVKSCRESDFFLYFFKKI